MPVSAPTNTLQAIQNKVRRITRSPSQALLSDSDLQNYINTFVVYDFPEHLRTFLNRTQFSFYTNPYQDVYPTNEASFGTATSAESNPLYNFQNKYLTIHPPVYVAGFQSQYMTSREQLFGYFPIVNSISSIGPNGDGATTNFTGVINANQAQIPFNFMQQVGLLQNNVLFTSADSNFNGLVMADVPVINPVTGNKSIIGNLYDANSAAYQAALLNPPILVNPINTINYSTGVFSVTFSSPPGPNQPINSESVPQNLGRPRSICFYANQFILRPVPDIVYSVNFETYVRPTWLMETSSVPELEEYWQYIAYGASKKIFEDRMDLDSVQLIMPEFINQQNLCNRRTIVQYTNDRVATIYTESNGPSAGGFGWGGSSST
jgi:hypothetical protein